MSNQAANHLEGMIGAGRSILKVGYSCLASEGVGRRLLVLPHVDLSLGLLEYPHNMAVGFPRASDKGKQERSQCLL